MEPESFCSKAPQFPKSYYPDGGWPRPEQEVQEQGRIMSFAIDGDEADRDSHPWERPATHALPVRKRGNGTTDEKD